MRQTVQFTLAAALIGLAAAACGEGTAPPSEQVEVLAAEADQLGAMVDTEFGVPGAAATAAATSTGSGNLAAPPAVGAAPPAFWGRLRVVPGGPRPESSTTSPSPVCSGSIRPPTASSTPPPSHWLIA